MFCFFWIYLLTPLSGSKSFFFFFSPAPPLNKLEQLNACVHFSSSCSVTLSQKKIPNPTQGCVLLRFHIKFCFLIHELLIFSLSETWPPSVLSHKEIKNGMLDQSKGCTFYYMLMQLCWKRSFVMPSDSRHLCFASRYWGNVKFLLNCIALTA